LYRFLLLNCRRHSGSGLGDQGRFLEIELWLSDERHFGLTRSKQLQPGRAPKLRIRPNNTFEALVEFSFASPLSSIC
jgi:hypothetical protein